MHGVLICDWEEADCISSCPVGDVRLPPDVLRVVHDAHNLELVLSIASFPCFCELVVPGFHATFPSSVSHTSTAQSDYSLDLTRSKHNEINLTVFALKVDVIDQLGWLCAYTAMLPKPYFVHYGLETKHKLGSEDIDSAMRLFRIAVYNVA